MGQEQGYEFAARHWGGEGVQAVKSNVSYGRRDVDGGRPRYPAGWSFRHSDGFDYRVWQDGEGWQLEANDGGGASFHREGDEWVVKVYFDWRGEQRFAAKDDEGEQGNEMDEQKQEDLYNLNGGSFSLKYGQSKRDAVLSQVPEAHRNQVALAVNRFSNMTASAGRPSDAARSVVSAYLRDPEQWLRDDDRYWRQQHPNLDANSVEDPYADVGAENQPESAFFPEEGRPRPWDGELRPDPVPAPDDGFGRVDVQQEKAAEEADNNPWAAVDDNLNVVPVELAVGGPADGNRLFYAPVDWVERVKALEPRLEYGEHYSRHVYWNLKEMSDLVQRGYSVLAYDHLLAAERENASRSRVVLESPDAKLAQRAWERAQANREGKAKK